MKRSRSGGIISNILFIFIVVFGLMIWLGGRNSPTNSTPQTARAPVSEPQAPRPQRTNALPARAPEPARPSVDDLTKAAEQAGAKIAERKAAIEAAVKKDADYLKLKKAAEEADKEKADAHGATIIKLGNEATAARKKMSAMLDGRLEADNELAAAIASEQAAKAELDRAIQEKQESERRAAEADQRRREDADPMIKIRRDATTWSAAGLVAAYEANEVSSDAGLKNRWFKVSGKVERVGKDILDNAYVALKGKDMSFRQVQCFFDKSNLNQIAELQPNQQVTILGKCDGLMGNVLMSKCEISR